ncbi:MAG: HAMP domain-containing histidine kinase [Candidatus Dormibacteraeota bacterium]|nr:HAMP domain-containing histidine kinase [Candidatus Dormibacteraeota bacterium]
MTRRLLGGPLGARLALAFLAVAAIAVGVISGLTLLSAQNQLSGLVSNGQRTQANDIATTLAQEYSTRGGWAGADLSGAYALAAAASAQLDIVDASGVAVATDPAAVQGLMQQMHGGASAGMMTPIARAGLDPPIHVPVLSGKATVGTALVSFPTTTPLAVLSVRDALARTVLVGATLAALAALVVAVFVSRRVTSPLTAITGATRTLRSGDRSARVGTGGPGELGELADTFNAMAETLEREEQVRRALVADVAHELRTPVTILQGQCEELLDGLAFPTPARLSSLHDEVLRLSHLVDDLESLNAAQTAGLRLERHLVDLSAVAKRAASPLNSRFDDADVELTSDLRSTAVQGDPERLHQVVVNLLTNALKYTPAGGHVSLRVDSDGALGCIEVRDDGRGIPADEIPHVFERFWRGSGATAAAGSGIGLAVVDELVRAHGGRVVVTSPEGKGACFRVLLPLPRP